MSLYDINLAALRAAEAERIAIDSVYIDVETYTTVEDVYGNQIPDYNTTPTTESKGPVRIANVISAVEEVEDSETPASIKESKYLLALYSATWLQKGLRFTHNGSYCETDIVQNNTRFGGLISKSCMLIDLTEK